MFSSICLALGLGLPAPVPAPARPPDGEGLVARIELQRGRALLVLESGVVPVKRHAGARVTVGPGHLELAPAARAVVRWPHRASLTLTGPTSVSWQELPSGELHWRFGTLGAAEIEVRGLGARTDLPDAWEVELGRGAYSFRGLPNGGTALEHRAGATLRARWIGGEELSPPPIALGPGDTAHLAGAPRIEIPVDATAETTPWSRPNWPWGRGGIPDIPDLVGDSSRPWSSGAWPWGPDQPAAAPWERWDWPWPLPEAALPPEPVPEADSTSVPLPVPFPEPDPVAEPEPGLVEEPTPEEPAPPPPSGNLWRGLPEDRLDAHPGFRLERSEDWIRKDLPDGRQRLELDSRARGPRWYLGREHDLRLFPGATATLEADGLLHHHTGWVRILTAVEGRVWPAD